MQMKRYLLLFITTLLIYSSAMAQLSSVPSPIIASTQAKIIYASGGSGPFYIYSWAKAGATDKAAVAWNSNIVDAYKLNNDGNGSYSFTIASLKTFYSLSDAELASVTQLGVLIRDASGNKVTPNDLFLSVIQTPPPPPYSGGGDGSVATPYLIANTADLARLSSTSADWSKAFKVTAPIVATNVIASIGNSSIAFTGVFNGNNQTISGSTLTGGNDLGFFGVVEGATISNVLLRSISIIATGNNVGGLIGSAKGATSVTACSVIGTVSSDGGAVGGLIGSLNGGTISVCFAKVGVSSKYGSAVGGFAGLSTGLTASIADCYETGNVSGVTSTAVGGFIGKLDNSSQVINCYATGSVGSGNEYVGGFVGANYSTIKNSFVTPASITSGSKFVAQFGGNGNSENISTGNIAWSGTTLASGVFSGFGDAATPKGNAAFNNQTSFNGLGGLSFTFSALKWKWDASSYPALNTPSDQTYPYPFSYSTALVSTIAKANITLYPTVFTETINLLGENVKDVRILDLMGNTVFETQELDITQSQAVLKLGNLTSGIYILRALNTNGEVATIKIIKK